MLDSDRLFYAQQTVERYAQLVKDLPTLVARLKEMRGGYPSGGLNGGGGGSDDTQPERKAGQFDKTEADVGRVDRLILQANGIAAELDNIRLSTLPRRGSADIGPEGCRSCARVRGKYSPVYRKDPPRCRWCYDRFLELQRDPPVLAVEWYLDGRKVTEKMMREALAAEEAHEREVAEKARRHGKGRDKRKRRARR